MYYWTVPFQRLHCPVRLIELHATAHVQVPRNDTGRGDFAFHRPIYSQGSSLFIRETQWLLALCDAAVHERLGNTTGEEEGG